MQAPPATVAADARVEEGSRRPACEPRLGAVWANSVPRLVVTAQRKALLSAGRLPGMLEMWDSPAGNESVPTRQAVSPVPDGVR